MMVVARPFATATRRFAVGHAVAPGDLPAAEVENLLRAGYLAPAPSPAAEPAAAD